MELRQERVGFVKILQTASRHIIIKIIKSGEIFSTLSSHLNLEFCFLVVSENAPDS